MKTYHFIFKIIVNLLILSAMTHAHAAKPLWTVVPLTATTLTISSNESAIVQFQITNHSRKSHTLFMKPIQGITQLTAPGTCPNPFVLNYQQSCILSLTVNGNSIPAAVEGGPVICQNDNFNQCYQPNSANSLKITRSMDANYNISGSVFGLMGTLVLQNNGGDTLNLNNDGSFSFATPVAHNATYHVTVLNQPVNQNCSVLNGSGTVDNSNISNISVQCINKSTTLTTSTSNLALSVTGLTEYGIPGTPQSGIARVIIITNTGANPATNLSVSLPTWPAGTISGTTCGSSLLANSSCTITITPGNTATSNGTAPCSNGTAPIADMIQVSADNANTVSTDVLILSYGCIYQNGYIYAFDDTPINTTSVGGKAATISDQAVTPNGIIWSSNGQGSTASDAVNDLIYGISETSTTTFPDPNNNQQTGQDACDGATDGACNTNNIYIYYQYISMAAPINPSYYAAGLCKQTISTYSDWYLPAICEMGYGFDAGCGSSNNPKTQNMLTNLVQRNNMQLISNTNYWSSTAFSSTNAYVWVQQFAPAASGQSSLFNKSSLLGVRCSRVLTN